MCAALRCSFTNGLKRAPPRSPRAPEVWICGDCHSGNLGPLASADGKIHVQIRDLDQTVIGNPNHDLIRLALSLASAARGSDLPGVTTAHMLEHMMAGYQIALTRSRAQNELISDRPEAIKVVMRRATARTDRPAAPSSSSSSCAARKHAARRSPW